MIILLQLPPDFDLSNFTIHQTIHEYTLKFEASLLLVTELHLTQHKSHKLILSRLLTYILKCIHNFKKDFVFIFKKIQKFKNNNALLKNPTLLFVIQNSPHDNTLEEPHFPFALFNDNNARSHALLPPPQAKLLCRTSKANDHFPYAVLQYNGLLLFLNSHRK